MKLLSLLLLFTVLAATPKSVKVGNGFATNTTDSKVVEVDVIESEKANELFRKFASDKDIPFKYPIDGCYARATEMANIAENERITLAKVYAEGDLYVKTSSSKYPTVNWGWHVAPIAYVKEGEKIQLMVFDPSLFDKPVPLNDWLDIMKTKNEAGEPGKVDTVYFGSRFQYFNRGTDKNKTSWQEKDLKHVNMTFKSYRPLQDLSASSNNSSQQSNKKTLQTGAQ